MTRQLLILSSALMFCLFPCLCGHSSEPGNDAGARGNVLEAEVDLKVQELKLAMAELELSEARVEIDKINLHIEAANEQGDKRKMDHLQLELKQATIRVGMRRVQSEMERLQVERARAALEDDPQPGDRSQVKLEYVDDADVVVVRGEKGDVEKTIARLEGEMIGSQPAPSSLDIKIFSIVNGDAQALASELKVLFPIDAASPIYVASDPRTNSVIARGTSTELAVVEAILLRLDGE